MLRAVLSVNECERVVREYPAIYVGEQFPALLNGSKPTNDFAVLSFRADETTSSWRTGYYRLDSDLTKLNEAILGLTR
jgi:hypothetical protein